MDKNVRSIREWKICKGFANRSLFDALPTSKPVITGSIKLYVDSCMRERRYDDRNELRGMKIDKLRIGDVRCIMKRIVRKTVKCRWFGHITPMITVTLH